MNDFLYIDRIAINSEFRNNKLGSELYANVINFAKNNIPVIFYFNGVHEDYHKPTDTIEKIDFEKIEKISKLIFLTAWEISNREERIRVDKKWFLNESGRD